MTRPTTSPAVQASAGSLALPDPVVLRFTDCTARVSVAQLCRDAGMTPAELADHLAALVAAGYMTPQSDGSYRATVPSKALP